MSLKSWWNSLWEDNKSANVQTPTVKGISEPVQTLVRLFKENTKRFKFEYEIHKNGDYMSWRRVGGDGRTIRAYSTVKITDIYTKEYWKFTMDLYQEAEEDCSDFGFYYTIHRFGQHRLYPALGCKVTSSPNWITEEEMKFISKTMFEYFVKRINRYKEIVNYRRERTNESHVRKTELDKKKERQRLLNIYKGE